MYEFELLEQMERETNDYHGCSRTPTKTLHGVREGCFIAKKDILAPKKLYNGMKRLVKIKKGTRYSYKIIRGRNVTLAKEIIDNEILKDAVKMSKDDFKKYFKEVNEFDKKGD